MDFKLQRKLALIPVLVYWPVIFILSHIPIPELVYKARVSDKAIHFLAYLILAFLLWYAVGAGAKVRWLKASVWWVVLVIIGYATIDEVLQTFVGRNADIMDFVADLIGGMAGLVVFSVFSFRPALLIVTATSIFLLTTLARANISNLIPITDVVFHLAAYGFLTLVWIRNIDCISRLKNSRAGWIIAGLAVPWIFLAFVKLFSLHTGREFAIRTVFAAAASITAVVAAAYSIKSLSGNFKRSGFRRSFERSI